MAVDFGLGAAMNRPHIPLLAGLILGLSWLYCCCDAA
ncbi:hypothetical protein DOY81_002536, partial [Sarcophaga bullata]